ncbi:MAG TPA: peroxiredoxin [Candidatus Binatia bacterium]|nr:peroxiredoxin [Candidatus Binatia bacterium]
MIAEGQRAPDVSGTTAEGERLSLADFRGNQPVILYFYPKDDTPGCTKEACSFRDHKRDIEAAGGALIGVSMDSAESHKKFIAKHSLNFPLLSDRDGAIAKAFGVTRLGGWMPLMPVKRVTFVIDRDGVVRRVIASELSMDAHVDGAIAALRELGSGAGTAPR